jgi:hypothetical protein
MLSILHFQWLLIVVITIDIKDQQFNFLIYFIFFFFKAGSVFEPLIEASYQATWGAINMAGIGIFFLLNY